jgi:hypothetical protein
MGEPRLTATAGGHGGLSRLERVKGEDRPRRRKSLENRVAVKVREGWGIARLKIFDGWRLKVEKSCGFGRK